MQYQATGVKNICTKCQQECGEITELEIQQRRLREAWEELPPFPWNALTKFLLFLCGIVTGLILVQRFYY